jgi:hypothetical protein
MNFGEHCYREYSTTDGEIETHTVLTVIQTKMKCFPQIHKYIPKIKHLRGTI